jgi:hypothetical protein
MQSSEPSLVVSSVGGVVFEPVIPTQNDHFIELEQKIDTNTRERKNKKTVQHATNIDIKTFSFSNDVILKDVTTGKVKIVPMSSKNGGPVILTINGGGNIPSFGVNRNTFKTDESEYTFTASIADVDDHKALDDISKEISDTVISNRDRWLPAAAVSDELLSELCNKLASVRKPKENGGEWDGLLKLTLSTKDLHSIGGRKPKLSIKNENGESIMNVNDIVGAKWTKIVFEMKCVYFGAKNAYGISKSVRQIRIEAASADYEVGESDDDYDGEDDDDIEHCAKRRCV